MPGEAGELDVVFVVLDTVRKDHLSTYGYERPTSPGLDAFAEEAAVYEEAVTPAPWTLPVHASLFTGLYPSEHNASQENPYLDGPVTLAEALPEQYASACYSSNAWITPYTGLTRGFDSQDNFFGVLPDELLAGPLAKLWRSLNDHDRLRQVADRLVEVGNLIHEYLETGEGADSKTPRVIDRTIEFIQDHEDYFVFINLMDAHLPYHPPAEYAAEFAPDVDPTAVCQNSKEYNCGARAIDDDEWTDIRGLYDAEIRHIDAELERLFGWMRANDEWEDTLVIVCADHGELHGEHGLFGHEFGLYDPVVNVPLLVKHPALSPERVTSTVELHDLFHTVLDTTGTNSDMPDVGFEPARSLLSDQEPERLLEAGAFIEYSQPVVELNQLESKAKQAGISLDEESRFYSRMRAVRTPSAKFIENERIDNEFYRLDEDPGETSNLHGAGDPVETELREALRAFTAQVGSDWQGGTTDDDVLADMDSQAKDRLRELGYLE